MSCKLLLHGMSNAFETLEIIAKNTHAMKCRSRFEYTDYSRSKGQSTSNAVNIGFDIILRMTCPDLTNKAAHAMGVGRGADLLFYLLTLVFLTYATNEYLNKQEDRDRLFRLARKVALLEADARYKKGDIKFKHWVATVPRYQTSYLEGRLSKITFRKLA